MYYWSFILQKDNWNYYIILQACLKSTSRNSWQRFHKNFNRTNNFNKWKQTNQIVESSRAWVNFRPKHISTKSTFLKCATSTNFSTLIIIKTTISHPFKDFSVLPRRTASSSLKKSNKIPITPPWFWDMIAIITTTLFQGLTTDVLRKLYHQSLSDKNKKESP